MFFLKIVENRMVLDENRESYWLGREYHLFRKEKWEICLLFLLFSFGLGAHVGKRAFFLTIFFSFFYTLHMSHSVQPGREWLVVCGKLPSLVVHTHTNLTQAFLPFF